MHIPLTRSAFVIPSNFSRPLLIGYSWLLLRFCIFELLGHSVQIDLVLGSAHIAHMAGIRILAMIRIAFIVAMHVYHIGSRITFLDLLLLGHLVLWLMNLVIFLFNIISL